MDIEYRKKVLEIALEALCYRIGDTKMLFANLEIPLTAEGAQSAGLGGTWEKFLDYQQTVLDISKELTTIACVQDGKPLWRRVGMTNGNGQSLGAVYICPHCDSKSPDDFPVCPHCGKIVGMGFAK